ncbi:uncharacterized protein LOC111310825 [Durio zibethinus]|uniref:Uncharacterized protein LOC111310825 n=1 Tax=Durio zibethinus TaxID=66656 RepID=A0A6P6AM67_DURZI|nr:uncharacterized protein LOC111310825 [Durio zibethinus]
MRIDHGNPISDSKVDPLHEKDKDKIPTDGEKTMLSPLLSLLGVGFYYLKFQLHSVIPGKAYRFDSDFQGNSRLKHSNVKLSRALSFKVEACRHIDQQCKLVISLPPKETNRNDCLTEKKPIKIQLPFLLSRRALNQLESERLPFDLPEAEEELVAGYQTEYSVLYLGVGIFSHLNVFVPELFEINKMNGIFGTTIGIFITLTKTYLFLFISIATRWTLPRLRMDQLLNLGWKFLLPISVIYY